MIPLGRSTTVDIDGHAYTISEPSAKCSAEIMDATAAGKSPIHLASITVFYCVRGWAGEAPKSPDEILDNLPARVLVKLANAVVESFPAEDDAGNFEAGPHAVSS